MLAKKTSKNQLTLPKEIANRFPGIDLFDATVEDNRIVLVPVKVTPVSTSLESIRVKMERLSIEEKDVKGAVRWARKRRQ
jgi:bifunctional DNA-binding transcriptional regulator/antitoxin component of YhaV-PrlF toxin-antitoxin module